MEVLTHAVADITVLEARGRCAEGAPDALIEHVQQAVESKSVHVVVVMTACDRLGEPELDSLIASRKILLRRAGDLVLVTTPAFTDYVSDRLGKWLPISGSESDGVGALSPVPELPPHARMIGFWARADEVSFFPNPHRLVAHHWRADQRNRIIRYLQAGSDEGAAWMGFSPCRFGCGAYGYRDLTDGTWYWPEGLAHYIEVHHVRLPEEFIQTMELNSWRIPRPIRAGRIFGFRIKPFPEDAEFWVGWAAREHLVPSAYGEYVAVVARVRQALEGVNFARLWHLSADDGRRIRALMRPPFDCGIVSPHEMERFMSGALPAVERLCSVTAA